MLLWKYRLFRWMLLITIMIHLHFTEVYFWPRGIFKYLSLKCSFSLTLLSICCRCGHPHTNPLSPSKRHTHTHPRPHQALQQGQSVYFSFILKARNQCNQRETHGSRMRRFLTSCHMGCRSDGLSQLVLAGHLCLRWQWRWEDARMLRCHLARKFLPFLSRSAMTGSASAALAAHSAPLLLLWRISHADPLSSLKLFPHCRLFLTQGSIPRNPASIFIPQISHWEPQLH